MEMFFLKVEAFVGVVCFSVMDILFCSKKSKTLLVIVSQNLKNLDLHFFSKNLKTAKENFQ